MVPGGEKKLSCSNNVIYIVKGVASKHKGNFNCLKCVNLIKSENNLSLHENVYRNYNYCHIFMPD